MPRKTKPPRLWLRESGDRWIILDRGQQIGTGCSGQDLGGAQAALTAYLNTKNAGEATSKLPTVGHVLAHYLQDRGDEVRDMVRLDYCAKALADFWADLPPTAVTRGKCKEYSALRRKKVSAATVRRELSMLKSALLLCDEQKRLDGPFSVWFPKKPAPRGRHFTRDELARLLRESAPHLRRFILISYYSGRRHRAVLTLGWEPSSTGGWIDMRGLRIHFLPEGEEETKKRRGSIPIPRPLLAHLKRWYRLDREKACRRVIQFRGKPVHSIRKAMTAAVTRAELRSAVPHALKHSAVTAYFEKGGDLADGEDYFATTQETLLRVYRKHSPIFAQRGADVMSRRR